MLKKLTAAVVATLMFGTAPSAFAWESVCVHYKGWNTWFSGPFAVVWSENHQKADEVKNFHGRFITNVKRDMYQTFNYNQVRLSNNTKAWQTNCVNIADVPMGAKIYVAILPDAGHVKLCDRTFFQQQRPYRTLKLDAHGRSDKAVCRFIRELDWSGG